MVRGETQSNKLINDPALSFVPDALRHQMLESKSQYLVYFRATSVMVSIIQRCNFGALDNRILHIPKK